MELFVASLQGNQVAIVNKDPDPSINPVYSLFKKSVNLSRIKTKILDFH